MVSANLDGPWSIPRGTDVYTAEGEKLGRVTDADAYALEIERGFLFFVQDYEVAFDQVDRYEDGKLFLNPTEDQL